MGLREKLNENPWIGIGVPVAIVIVAVFFLTRQILGPSQLEGISSKAYFTTDDTATGQAAVNSLFAASVSNVPPFDHGGKPAYRAVCFSCNGGRSVWVQFLYRYTPSMYDKVQTAYSDAQAKGNRLDPDLSPFESGMEVKTPGSGTWIKMSSPAASSVTHVTPPDGVPSDDLAPYVP